jgi:hypothetical protein
LGSRPNAPEAGDVASLDQALAEPNLLRLVGDA